VTFTIVRRAATLGIAVITAWTEVAVAAEIHVMVSGALTGAFRDLVPHYERTTGYKLVIAWGPSSGTSREAIPVRLESGETADVLIMVAPALDKLVAEGKFPSQSRAEIARSRIGVAVRKGASRPDVGSVDALRRTLLEANSIGYSEGASGVYVATELLSRLGIADQVAGKARKITGQLVGEALARGEIEVGLQQISELIAVSGIDYVGALPDEIQKVSVIAAAIARDAREPRGAKALVDFLSSSQAAPALVESGLDAVPQAK
jgi:molybdate transport system substrate-binding protein